MMKLYWRGIMMAALLAGPAEAANDTARCQRLIAQYDRYVTWPDDHTPIGYMQREIGEQECKAGRYSSGIIELEMALRLIGFPPTP